MKFRYRRGGKRSKGKYWQARMRGMRDGVWKIVKLLREPSEKRGE